MNMLSLNAHRLESASVAADRTCSEGSFCARGVRIDGVFGEHTQSVISQVQEQYPDRRYGLARDSRIDLEAMVQTVPSAYSGYADKRALMGATALRQATEAAFDELASVNNERDCDELLRRWLGVFRDRHVSLKVPIDRAPVGAGFSARCRSCP